MNNYNNNDNINSDNNNDDNNDNVNNQQVDEIAPELIINDSKLSQISLSD